MSDRSKSRNGKKEFKQLEMLLIRRAQVKQSLVMVSVLALLISSCRVNYNQPWTSTRSNPSQEKVEAIFYENVAQCEADTKKKWTEYQAKLAAHQKKEITIAPEEPKFKPENCQTQMSAARQDYEKNAPVYNNLNECQKDGVQCERVQQGSSYRYRPTFGGSYFYYRRNNYLYIPFEDRSSSYYQPGTVYRSRTPGEVITPTPTGRTRTRTSPGIIQFPQGKTRTVTTPQRPTSSPARGGIKGRGSRGFGSTFKGTGRSGK